MKQQFRSLLLSFFVFYIVLDPLREMLQEHQSIQETFWWLSDPRLAFIGISTLLIFLLYAFGTYLVLLKNYPVGRKQIAIGLLPVVAAVGIALRYISQEVIGLYIFGEGNYRVGTEIVFYIFDNLYYVILYMGLGIVYFFIQYAQFKEQQTQALMLETKQTELSLLRSQVNPHFLFNTLNNIYTLVYQKSDKALQAMERLTSLLRYALYEPEEFVPLEKELKAIEDFVTLQELRYGYTLNLLLDVQVKNPQAQLPPFTLIPFVENAFKHGDLKASAEPTIIRLHANGTLDFSVKNSISNGNKDKVGGIGLENVRKRLLLIYGKNYQLNITKDVDTFKVNLNLPLQ